MPPQPLVIVGAGGHGREVLDVVEALNERAAVWAVAGFLDDGDGPFDLVARRGAGVLGPVAALADIEGWYVAGVADPGVRRRIDQLAAAHGRRPATLVHPAATVAGDAEVGPGSVLAAGVRVTANARLGRHVHLDVNSSVSHDCQVGDYVTLAPGAVVGGSVALGEGAYVGAGATVIQNLALGAGAVVGAGAAVVRDVPPGTVVVGVPARPQP